VTAPIIEGFSLSHAQVLDGTETFVEALQTVANADEWDIYGVNNGSLEPNTDSYDNEGDDAVLSTWEWLNYAEVAVQAGYMSFPLISNITGEPISSGTIAGGATAYAIDMWTERTMNVARRPMILQMPAKTAQGAVAKLVLGLYSVSFAPITFDGPAYKDGLKVNYGGKALMSAFDEKGVAFADGIKRVARTLAIIEA
jgi:hypothetical protein